jgi:hypothetical protein
MKLEKARSCLPAWMLEALMGLLGGLWATPPLTLLGAVVALEASHRWAWWRARLATRSRVCLDTVTCALPAVAALLSGGGVQATRHVLPCVTALAAIQLGMSRAAALLMFACFFWLLPSAMI